MPTRPDCDNLSRRTFLTQASTGAALLAASPLTALRSASATDTSRLPMESAPAPKRYPIGIELYAVRNELTRDLPNTLRTVQKQGYQVVEFYAPYLAWTLPYAKDVRTMLDDLGLRCYSTHNGFGSLTPGDTMTKAIEINQILGSRSIVLAAPPFEHASPDEWMQFSAKLAAASEQLRPHGLAAGFHNHDAEWAALPDGRRVMDIIATNTPNDFILQLDVGTCVKAGADPVAWVNAHPGRIRSVHLKDWAPGAVAQEKEFRVLFGEGVTPWARLLGALEASGGVEFYLMEQEGSRFSEFETAQRCLANWKRMRRQ
jgi:sugar phosphate isomerase/epimerase